MTERTVRHTLAVALLAVLVALSGCSASALPNPIGDTGDASPIEFHDVTNQTGLDYASTAGSGVGNGNEGVYVADVNDDGWSDVLALGGDRPALFTNDHGTFERSDALAKLDRPFKSASFVDVDQDGWIDILLFSKDGDVVGLRNEQGSFTRAVNDFGLGNLTYPLGAAVADYDSDGDPDLFVYQSGDWANGTPKGYFNLEGHITDDNGNPNYLYENDGGAFQRANASGIRGDYWSLAASFTDLNGDGRPDIHVANDFNNDTIYLNEGDGTFQRKLLGGATARNGMASEIADVNGDGRPDIFVTNIYLPLSKEKMGKERYERLKDLFTFVFKSGRTKGNTLMINEGNGSFVDRADQYGVRHGGWGWAASFSDFDNDGRLDLLSATQNVVRIDPDNPKYTYPMLWTGRDGEFTSLEAPKHGLKETDGRGMATLDFDRDGRIDVIKAVYGGEFRVYRNVGPRDADHNSLEIRVVRGPHDVTAHGATVTVEAGDRRAIRFVGAQNGYLSQESRVLHVGVGSQQTATLVVRWPDGTTRRFEDVSVNRRLRISKSGVTVVASYGGNTTAD